MISALKVLFLVYEKLLSDVTVTCGVVFVSLTIGLFDTRVGEGNVTVLINSFDVVCFRLNTVEGNVSDVLFDVVSSFIVVSRTVLVVAFALDATIGVRAAVSVVGLKVVVLALPAAVLDSEDKITAAVVVNDILDLYADQLSSFC